MPQIGAGTLSILCAVCLGALLGIASWTDVCIRRISNKLVLAGAITGLTLNTVLPEGSGLFSAVPGGLGFFSALAGFAVGLGLLLPFYLVRSMGAGDVKLMAMIGAFLGPTSIIGAVLMTLIAGGILALAVALSKGVFRSMLDNVQFILIHTMMKVMSGHGAQVELSNPVVETLPYALAITAGTVVQIFLARNGLAFFK